MAFSGVLGTRRGMLGDLLLGAGLNTGTTYVRSTNESVPVTSDMPVRNSLAYRRTTLEATPPTFDLVSSTGHTFTRATHEVIPTAVDSTDRAVGLSTFLATKPLPIYVNVYDALMSPVGSIGQILTRPVFRSSINGGFQSITLDLPASTTALQNGYIVEVYEQGGDGSRLYRGVIENLPDTYAPDAAHSVVVSPMVVFLGSTDYTANWKNTDIGVIVRDIVSQCPYLSVTPTSVPNVAGFGNLLSAENASFEGGTTGDWQIGYLSGMMGTPLGELLLGSITDSNEVITNVGSGALTTTGLLGKAILGEFAMGTLLSNITQRPGADGFHALQIAFTGSVMPPALANLRVTGTPVAAGNVYTALASLRAASTSRNWTVTIAWQDVSEVVISTVTGAAALDNPNAYTQVSATGVAPTGAVSATVLINSDGAASSEFHYLDAVAMSANASLIWTPGVVPGSVGTATLNFNHVSALQALTTCIQTAGPNYYFFVDESGLVWLSRLDATQALPNYQLAMGADFSARAFSAPIDTLCNFVGLLGGNMLWSSGTTLSTAIPASADILSDQNALFNVLDWNPPPDLFTFDVDSERILARAYGDLEMPGPGDKTVRIYQRGYAGTPITAHAAGAAITVFGVPVAEPITAFYDGTMGNPKRALIPPGTFPDCYDYATLQHIANTLGTWLNRKVVNIQLTLPDFGHKIRLNHPTAPTVSYFEPASNPLVESYVGTGQSSPPYMITGIEIDGGVQTLTLSDMPFTSEDLQYFVENMFQNSMVVASGAMKFTDPASNPTPAQVTGF